MSEPPDMPPPSAGQGSTWPRNGGVSMPPAAIPLPPRVSSAHGPAWPTVLGVVSIVVGAWTMLEAGAWLPARLLFLHRRSGSFGLASLARPLTDLQPSAAALLRLVLIAGGVLLILRRRAAVWLHVIYAIGMFLATGAWLVLLVRRDMLDHPSAFYGYGRALVWLMYPLFVLAWFARPAVRARVRQWRAGHRLAPASPVWPSVLAAVAVVLAVHQALLDAWDLALIWRQLQPWDWNIDRQWWEMQRKGLTVAAITNTGSMILAMLMIIGGRLLARRRPAAAAWLTVYAALAIAMWLVLPLVAWRVYQRHVLDAVAMLAVNVPMVLRELAFPAFVLIWLLRPQIREQVRSWRRARSDGWHGHSRRDDHAY